MQKAHNTSCRQLLVIYICNKTTNKVCGNPNPTEEVEPGNHGHGEHPGEGDGGGLLRAERAPVRGTRVS